MASAKPAAIASCPSDRWLVPFTRFCRNRSKARCSASRRRTCERYRSRRFCSPISSFKPEPAGTGARSFIVAMNVPRRVEICLKRAELSPDEREAATLLFDHRLAGGGLAHPALPVQQIEARADHHGRPRHGPMVGHVVEHQIAQD